MVSGFFEPKGNEKERSKATSTAELQQIEVNIQPHKQARLKMSRSLYTVS